MYGYYYSQQEFCIKHILNWIFTFLGCYASQVGMTYQTHLQGSHILIQLM